MEQESEIIGLTLTIAHLLMLAALLVTFMAAVKCYISILFIHAKLL